MATSLNTMIACNIYISEGRNVELVKALEKVASSVKEAACVWTFRDAPYHRTGFTLLARRPAPLAAAATALVGGALSSLDLTQHQASHPRLGVVDHVSCHPVPQATPQGILHANLAASLIGERVGAECGVPCLMYGTADPQGRRLADIRRAGGYFRGEAKGVWTGSSIAGQLPFPADFGPDTSAERSGIVCIGAGPWVVNYNVMLHTADLKQARLIARSISTRGGGPPGVEAMALPHGEGCVEIACNLLDVGITPKEVVLVAIERLASEQNIQVGEAYTTNQDPEHLIDLAEKQHV